MNRVVIEKFDSRNCILKASRGEHLHKMLPEKWPGFADWIIVNGRSFIKFRPSANNIKYINENWPEASWEGEAEKILIDFINNQQLAANASENKKKIIEDDGSYEYKLKPFDHQRQAFMLSRDLDAFAFFMEQGTGKTKVGIDSAVYSYSKGEAEALIVIAPNGVHSNWIDNEIPDHIPDWCPYSCWTYTSRIANVKKVQQQFEEFMKTENNFKIFAFNIECFTSETARKFIERILRTYKCYAILDESQGIKSHKAERTKYLLSIAPLFVKRRIMTGTNITQGVQDLYGQLSFLDKNILGYDTFTSYRNNFCTMGGYKMKNIVGVKNVGELISLIDPFSYRVLKKDCLDLPPKNYKRWSVELTPRQKQLYHDLNKYFQASMEGGVLTAQNAMIRLLRSQQIVCGWMPTDDNDLIMIDKDNPRVEAVLQHCRNTSGAVLVWAKFKQDIRHLCNVLGEEFGRERVATYYGDTSPEDRMKNVDRFQGGELKAMICSRSAARGLTLTACENPIYYANDFDLEVRLQSEDRCHRIGTVNSVTYTDVEAKGTVDVKIIRALRSKKSIADLINQDPDSFFLDSYE